MNSQERKFAEIARKNKSKQMRFDAIWINIQKDVNQIGKRARVSKIEKIKLR